MSKGTMRSVLRFVIALVFVGAGVSHFTTPDPFVAMMPAFLPWHLELVYLSGVFEILGGIGLVVARTQRAAAWGLLALLLAVFPANINMAVNEIYLFDMPQNAWLLWARLPLQFVLAAAVYWVGLSDKAEAP